MTTTPHLISLPVGESGQRIFPIHCDWSKDTQYIIDFASQGASNNITVVQSVFINNEKGTADITLDISGTASGYTVMAGQVGVFPIYANGLPKITLTAEQGSGQTAFAFANFSQSLFAYSAALIAQAVSDETLREASDVNPQNKHSAVTTYDPAVVQAIKEMQAATGLDFKFDGAGNALVSINTGKDIKGGILTDIGNAALSGGALKTVPQGLPIDGSGDIKVAQQGTVGVIPASTGAFNDTRMTFDGENRLQCVVGEITLNGGNVTVETQDKYDAKGSLIATLHDNNGNPLGVAGSPTIVRFNEPQMVTVAENYASGSTRFLLGPPVKSAFPNGVKICGIIISGAFDDGYDLVLISSTGAQLCIPLSGNSSSNTQILSIPFNPPVYLPGTVDIQFEYTSGEVASPSFEKVISIIHI